MPWRHTPTPYFVLVSEVMLQQTQVPRVMPKFAEFTQKFPHFTALANAPLGDVLAAWNGLGYNRRAKFLWRAAQIVQSDFGGELPKSVHDLTKLPGIGPNTAGAIMAYAYNMPVAFIETNIRTVFIHHFFTHSPRAVTDTAIKELVIAALPADNTRQWYWALMDYGTHLKATAGTQLHRVHGYRAQSKFSGSRRQIRGQVIRLLLNDSLGQQELKTTIGDERLDGVIEDLIKEGLIIRANGLLSSP